MQFQPAVPTDVFRDLLPTLVFFGMATPHCLVLGGPNGAGKSTLAPVLLSRAVGIRHFVNADVIARGLSGFAPEAAALEAGKTMLRRLDELAARRESFAFESTLSARSFAPWLQKLRESGYHVAIGFVWIASVDLAIQRVAHRVRLGGHGIPPDDIRRRYGRCIANFHELYRPLADTWEVYDNTQPPPRLIAFGGNHALQVLVPATWELILTGDHA